MQLRNSLISYSDFKGHFDFLLINNTATKQAIRVWKSGRVYICFYDRWIRIQCPKKTHQFGVSTRFLFNMRLLMFYFKIWQYKKRFFLILVMVLNRIILHTYIFSKQAQKPFSKTLCVPQNLCLLWFCSKFHPKLW